MNRNEIIAILKKHNFNSADYIVLSTGSMVLQGIKEKANDIDLAVSEKLYNELLKNYECTLKYEYDFNGKNMKIYSFEEFDFGLNYFDKENAVIIDGISVQNFSSILEFKKYLKREKDIIDIKLIEEYINGNN